MTWPSVFQQFEDQLEQHQSLRWARILQYPDYCCHKSSLLLKCVLGKILHMVLSPKPSWRLQVELCWLHNLER